MAPLCFAMSFLIAASSVFNLSQPNLRYTTMKDGLNITIAGVDCPRLTTAKMEGSFNESVVRLALDSDVYADCTVGIRVMKGETDLVSPHSKMHFDLLMKGGEEMFVEAAVAEDNPCLPERIVRNYTTMDPKLSNMKLIPDSGKNFWINLMMPFISIKIENMMKGLLDKAVDDLGKQFVSRVLKPVTQPPPMLPGATPVSMWPVGKAIRNVVKGLPNIFILQLDASFPSETAIRLSVKVLDDWIHTWKAFSVSVPKGLELSVDVFFPRLLCQSKLDCVAADGGIQIANVRATGGGELNRAVDNFIGEIMANMINKIVSSVEYDDGGKKVLRLDVPETEYIYTPPTWLLLFIVPALSIVGTMIVALSANRHIVKPVLNMKGERISVKRVIMEDFLVTGLAITCIFMFIWSNTTSNASVVVGGEIRAYSFSLINTIEDLWNAGLYPLAILVFFFSGVYPYVKLLSIIIYAVVLQRPQSRILLVFGNLGKFSLLDTFVMAILKTGLEVNGIAEVRAGTSFWIFVTATVLSILVGNYATYGWRNETTVMLKGYKEMCMQDSTDGSGSGSSTEEWVRQHSGVVRDMKAAQVKEVRQRLSSLLISTVIGRVCMSPFVTPPIIVEDGTIPTYEAPLLSNELTDNSVNGATDEIHSQCERNVKDDVCSRPISIESNFGSSICSVCSPKFVDFALCPEHEAVREKKSPLRHDDEDLAVGWRELLVTKILTWEWYFALPAAAFIVAVFVVTATQDVLQYNMTGLATIITGSTKSLNIWSLFIKCDPYLLVVGVWTVLFAPILYVLVFPHARMLAAWCSTDAFLLACVASLIQLEQYIKFILGKAMTPVYSVSCILQWPLILLGVSMVVQWLFILKQTIGIHGLPKPKKVVHAFSLRH